MKFKSKYKKDMKFFGRQVNQQSLSVFLLLIFTVINPNLKSWAQDNKVKIVNLNTDDKAEFHSIRKVFMTGNPGYDLNYLDDTKLVNSRERTQVVFVQAIEGVTDQEGIANVVVTADPADSRKSQAIVGDIIILNKGEVMQSDIDMGLLVFTVPVAPSQELPTFIRPDWDPNITDVPGGCATEIDDYRRILLTWREDVGKYIYHALNAHRVRIRDSFSHFHPVNGGFDEFYLVQMVEPGGKIFTSEQTTLINQPGKVKKDEVKDLIQAHQLKTGDLVYLPKGVVHRGFGGVLVQVITIPGFIPGSEIGVDHHLRAINQRLGLKGNKALPYNMKSSASPVIR